MCAPATSWPKCPKGACGHAARMALAQAGALQLCQSTRPVYCGALTHRNLGEAFAPALPRGFCGIIQQRPGLLEVFAANVLGCAKLEEIFDPPWCAVARLGEFGDAAGLLRTTLMINDLVNSAQDVSASVCCALRTQDVARS